MDGLYLPSTNSTNNERQLALESLSRECSLERAQSLGTHVVIQHIEGGESYCNMYDLSDHGDVDGLTKVMETSSSKWRVVRSGEEAAKLVELLRPYANERNDNPFGMYQILLYVMSKFQLFPSL